MESSVSKTNQSINNTMSNVTQFAVCTIARYNALYKNQSYTTECQSHDQPLDSADDTLELFSLVANVVILWDCCYNKSRIMKAVF
jgi:hypothetical protein